MNQVQSTGNKMSSRVPRRKRLFNQKPQQVWCNELLLRTNHKRTNYTEASRLSSSDVPCHDFHRNIKNFV